MCYTNSQLKQYKEQKAMCSKIYMSEERRCNLLAETWYYSKS